MRNRVFGLFCAALVLAACAETDRTAVTSSATPTTTATISNPVVAAARKECGAHVLPQVGTWPETAYETAALKATSETEAEAAYRCFIEAVGSRRPAHVKETRLTAEGDPIPVTYIADAQGRVEVSADSRSDTFGTRVVTRQMCSGPVVREGHLTFANCAKAQRPAEGCRCSAMGSSPSASVLASQGNHHEVPGRSD